MTLKGRLRGVGLVLGVASVVFMAAPVLLPTRAAAAAPAAFLVGAAVADFTPPCGPDGTPAVQHCVSPPPGFTDPANCIPAADSAFPGKRLFAFTEPYVDAMNSGHWDPGDPPWMDCPVPSWEPSGPAPDLRWDGNYIGGGSNAPRFYDYVADPLTARAMVVSNGTRTIAVEVLDHEGAFNTYLARIRQLVGQALPSAALKPEDIFISSTHDESAPDSIGLYGPTPVSSSVNPFWADYMATKGADAIVRAYRNMQPARIRYTEAIEPADMRQCFSSYPFVDDQLMPTLQAVNSRTGGAIVTLADVSQHTETMGFNGGSTVDPGAPPGQHPTLDDEKRWLTADWPVWFRGHLESTYGGVGIEMAGSVGSNETPEVFSQVLSRTPEQFIDESHPAGCRTLYNAHGTKTPLGYYSESKALGQQLAQAVEQSLAADGTDSASNDIFGARADACIHLSNTLFTAAAAAGVFGERAGYDDTCTVQFPTAADGSTLGTAVKTQVAAFRIGDGEFVSLPGEVFPFTYLRGFQGPNDMACPDPSGQTACAGSGTYPLPPWLMPHMHTRYRFIDGLGEDMVGYIFPRGNGVGVPGEYNNAQSVQGNSGDRFGCGHSDDSEAANSQSGDVLGQAAMGILDANGGPPEDIAQGRYVFPDGSLSRDPLGGPETKCNLDKTFSPRGPAIAVWLKDGGVVQPSSWMSLGGRSQFTPDRNTRGYIDVAGARHWLEVFPDISGQPASVSLPGGAASSPTPVMAAGGGLPGTAAAPTVEVPAAALGLILLALAGGGFRFWRRDRR
ncbi:MAG TPA: hypothetical protein VIN56_04720 [Candidatus Dormibacteraeota bacterium]